jgi:hypothetical protein
MRKKPDARGPYLVIETTITTVETTNGRFRGFRRICLTKQSAFRILLRDWGAVLEFLKELCRRVKRGQALARLELDLETLGTLVVELPAVNTVRTSLLLLWRYLSFE